LKCRRDIFIGEHCRMFILLCDASASWQFVQLTAGVPRETSRLMNIQQATREYEKWMAGHIRIVKTDLDAKHRLMARDPFSFLRATFYRWMQLFPELCPKLASAPPVLAVGDLHVENYGTWRDAEGRLVWGINDFDEAFPLPYTVDLVRLAASARLAVRSGQLSLAPGEGCAAILEGYSAGIAGEGNPFVLSERHPFLRDAATGRLRDPVLFWGKLTALPTCRQVPPNVMRVLRGAMPHPKLAFRVAHRRAGLGSLGRERYTAITEWGGGWSARETKPLLPSACAWACGTPDDTIYYPRIVANSVRMPDPFFKMDGTWVLRRLSPYCSRIELSHLPRKHDAQALLRAMGRELANVHLGSRRAVAAVRRDLAKRKPKWLRQAAEDMLAATLRDWKDWRGRKR
jgi:hypothetical protein